MSDDSDWVRSRAALALLLAAGLEQWVILQKLRFALANGVVRGRAQVAIVGPDYFHGWDVPPGAWGADIMVSTLSLRLDEYSAQTGATPGFAGAVKLAGLSFHSGDFRSFFELADTVATASAARPAKGQSRAGRKAGQVTYLSDAGIVERAISICDQERLPLAKAITRLLPEIEPRHLEDASKKRRIRNKVLEIRPDLSGD